MESGPEAQWHDPSGPRFAAEILPSLVLLTVHFSEQILADSLMPQGFTTRGRTCTVPRES
jgi:hypothetical protein